MGCTTSKARQHPSAGPVPLPKALLLARSRTMSPQDLPVLRPWPLGLEPGVRSSSSADLPEGLAGTPLAAAAAFTPPSSTGKVGEGKAKEEFLAAEITEEATTLTEDGTTEGMPESMTPERDMTEEAAVEDAAAERALPGAEKPTRAKDEAQRGGQEAQTLTATRREETGGVWAGEEPPKRDESLEAGGRDESDLKAVPGRRLEDIFSSPLFPPRDLVDCSSGCSLRWWTPDAMFLATKPLAAHGAAPSIPIPVSR